MTADDIRRIWSVFGLDRKAARTRYAEKFGRAVDDPRIDQELTVLFEDRDHDSATVAVPAYLLLAIVMRAPLRGGGRKGVSLQTWNKRRRALAIRNAEMEWARQVEKHGPKVSKQAKHSAAKAAYANFIGHGLKTVKALEAEMRRERGKRAIAKK